MNKLLNRMILAVFCVSVVTGASYAARNGSGTYTAPSNSWNPVVSGTTISSSDFNDLLDDLETAITNSVAKDGQTTITGNQSMSTYKHTNVGDATARTQYLTLKQYQDGDAVELSSVSGTDTITATAPFSLSAYAQGQVFRFVATGTNTTAVTFNINSIGAKAVQKLGAALVAGDITTGDAVEIYYDGTQFQILTPARTPVLTAGSIATASIADNAVTTGKIVDDAVTTDKIVDDAVTSDKIADGIIKFPLGYRYGGILSNNSTDSDHDIDVTAGAFRGASNAADITLSAITKRIDASWSAGTGNGGLSSSLTLSNSTWYHVFAIIVGGNADVGFDTSATAANLVTDHSATAYRYLGSVKTDGSANIVGFLQNEKRFTWKSPPLDLSATAVTATASTHTLASVPTGIKVRALVSVNASGGGSIYLSDLNQTDLAPSDTAAPLASASDNIANKGVNPVEVVTDTSAQIRARSSGSQNMNVATRGWEIIHD